MNKRMNKKQIKKQIPTKALELLPWYATGRLSPEEREHIQKILSENPEFRKILDREHQIINTIKEDKSILDHSCLETTETRLEKVLERLPLADTQKTSEKSKQGFLISLSNLFSDNLLKVQYGILAAITILSITLLFAFISPLVEKNTIFYPAASSVIKSNNDTTTLLIGLNADMNHPRLLRILKENNAIIETIPGKSRMHHLRLSVKLNGEQTKNLLKKLTNDKELFWFAGEEF